VTDPVLVVLSVARIGVVILGLAVAARGLRGYRRTGNRALLAFGVAFGLISLNPFVGMAAGTFFDARTTGYVAFGSDVVLFGTAFSLVLYTLYRLT
jgi:hypothetical protein